MWYNIIQANNEVPQWSAGCWKSLTGRGKI